ncbi:MAG: hypothetical protein HLUCCA13_14560 [Halomonas sp. HL-48]|nr:MAG: hypothetical protein HLUCCA13_14560 [Halomonas sp. HL-48]
MVLSHLPKSYPAHKGLDDGINNKYLTLNVMFVLVFLLTVLLGLFEINSIEMIIVILSVITSSIGQLLRFFYSESPPVFFPSELIETLDAIGAAEVGTLVLLYLLA